MALFQIQNKDLLIPKTCCKIKTTDGNDYYDFVVEGLLKDAFIVQAIKKGDIPCWKATDKINVQILTDSAIYEFSSAIICSINASTPTYVLEMPQQINRIQRKRYVRYDYSLTLSFSPIDSEAQWKSICPRLHAKTINISGGGLCFTWSNPIREKTLLAITLNLPYGRDAAANEIPIKALGEVKRCTLHNGIYSIGVQFKEIDERNREQIISFIFEQMGNNAKSRLRYTWNIYLR